MINIIYQDMRERTVTLECQLVFESKLKLVLYAAQDLAEIPNKLGKVQGPCLRVRLKLPTGPRMVLMYHGSLVVTPRV